MRPDVSLCAIVALTLFAIACGSDDKGGGGPLSGNPGGGASSGASPASGGGSASNASLVNPCNLFTKEDAAAALGKPVLDGKLTPSAPPLGQAICFYGASDERSTESVQLSVVQTAGMTEQVRRGGQSAKTLHDGTKASVASKTDVSGIGQDAFIGATSIYVLKGDTHFSILLFGNGRPGDASHSNALRTAAGKVVGKLP